MCFPLVCCRTSAPRSSVLPCLLQEWLDYVLYLRAHLQPSAHTLTVLEARWGALMPMCWDPNRYNVGAYRAPHSDECHDTDAFDELSDHYPVVSDLTFP